MSFTERVMFLFVKSLAVRAIRELYKDDHENLWVQRMVKRIEGARSQVELDKLLAPAGEDDWVEVYVKERVYELVGEVVG